MASENDDKWPIFPNIPPPMAWLDEDLLPETDVPGLYLLLDASGGIVYIGQSSHVRTRLQEHRSEGVKRFARAKWIAAGQHSDRLTYESILILACRPAYNRAVSVGFTADGKAYDLMRATFIGRKAKGRVRKSKGKKA